MADTEKKLVDQKKLFEDAQLQAIELSGAETGDVIDFQKAQELGLIDETRGKIDDVFRGHESSFRDALKKERGQPSSRDALKAAFGAVYMPFLLKNTKQLEELQPDAMKKFKTVLKFPVQDEIGLKDRPELMAAMRRIQLITASRKGGEQNLSESIAIFKKNKQKTETEFQKLIDERGLLNENNIILREDGKTLTKNEYTDKMLEMDNILSDLKKTLDDHVKYGKIMNSFNSINTSFHSLFDGKKITPDAWRNFLKKDLKDFIKQLKRQPYLWNKDKVPPTLEQEKIIDGGQKFREQVKKLIDCKDYLNKNFDSFLSLKSEKVDIAQNEQAQAVLKRDIFNFDRKIGVFEGYKPSKLGIFDKEITEAQKKRDEAMVKRDQAKDRLAKFRATVQETNKEVGDRAQELINLEKDVIEFEEEVKRDEEYIIDQKKHIENLKSVDILTKAFGGADSVALNKAQMDVTEAEKNVKTGQELQEYFLGSNLEKLATLYKKLENNLAVKLETFLNDTAPLTIEEVPLEAKISELEEKVKERMDSRDRKDRSGNYVEGDREGITNNQIIPAQKNIKKLKASQRAAKEFHAFLLDFTEHLASLLKLGIIESPKGDKIIDMSDILRSVRSLDPEAPNFTCKALLDIVTDINPYRTIVAKKDEIKTKFNEGLAGLANTVKDEKRKLNDLESKKKENKNLTDAQAAKKIITVMLNEQFPDMSLEDLQKVATMILAEDVATIQSADNYEEFAKKASADVLDVAKDSAAREKLVGLRFKVDGKFVQPFKGFKPKDFESWPSIEKLFKIGKLNHQNGFLAYAALKNMEHPDVPSIQTIKMEKKLKELIAKELGVEERMDEAGISRIVDKAFEEQLKQITPLVTDFSTKYNSKRGEWGTFKTQEFKNKFEILAEELRLKKISDEIYRKRFKELSEEALEAGVGDRFGLSQNAELASFWNSKESQWLRDRGHDAGQWAKEKAKGLGMSGIKIAWRAGLGSAKLGLSLGWQAALMPFRVLKYPLKLLGLLTVRPFRKTPWAPLAIRSSLRKDFGKVLGYSKIKAKNAWEGTKGAGTVTAQEWKKRTTKMKKYSERTKIDNAKLKSEADELEAKANEEVAVEVASIPYIKLDKYKSQIEQLNKIISRGGSEEAAAA